MIVTQYMLLRVTDNLMTWLEKNERTVSFKRGCFQVLTQKPLKK